MSIGHQNDGNVEEQHTSIRSVDPKELTITTQGRNVRSYYITDVELRVLQRGLNSTFSNAMWGCASAAISFGIAAATASPTSPGLRGFFIASTVFAIAGVFVFKQCYKKEEKVINNTVDEIKKSLLNNG